MIEKQTWQAQLLALVATNTMSRRQAAKMVGVPRTTGLDFLKKYYGEMSEDEIPDKYDNSCILVISDLHFPYEHKDTFDFLEHLKNKYNPTRVIQVGDEVDYSACNYHESDPDLYSAGYELEKAKQKIKRLEKLFPEMDLLDSNHGSMIWRKAKTHGIPRAAIKSYNEVLGVSDKWKWYNDLIITLPNGQRAYFCHGRSADGLKLSKNMACNTIQGHHHSKFNVSYWSNPDNLFWSLQVGCLVDSSSLAMSYNKLTLDRPIIGCAVIKDSKPILEEMKL